ncbi:hypothetical protein [Frankia sp. AgB32]|uniref:hypothetical protein n=1 Tax=Frankia sp. AgB32 TaxID=631119 RepID=UPI00200C075E|nr:hypothetical protein [Frankia sp. AgB32]MCK9896950.1 hypothetical protein [Frankia sp. AgB32]
MPYPSSGRFVHVITADPGPEPDERTPIATAPALIVDSDELRFDPRVAVQVFHPDGRIEHRAGVRVYDTGRETLAAIGTEGWEKVAFWPGGSLLETPPGEYTDPREALRALAVKLEERATRAASEDAAPFYAEAARIWEFLAAKPRRPSVAVHRAQQKGGMVDVEQVLAAEIARSARTRNGAV